MDVKNKLAMLAFVVLSFCFARLVLVCICAGVCLARMRMCICLRACVCTYGCEYMMAGVLVCVVHMRIAARVSVHGCACAYAWLCVCIAAKY